MRLAQWIRDGESYRIIHHDPPVSGILGSYPYSVQKRNNRIGLFFWSRVTRSVNYESAVLAIVREKERALPVLPFQRSNTVVTEAPPIPEIPKTPDVFKPTTSLDLSDEFSYEYRAVEVNPPVETDGFKYPIKLQYRVKTDSDTGTWFSTGHCLSEDKIDEALHALKERLSSHNSKEIRVIKQVD